MTVAMSGFGVFDGKYFVKKTTHAVGGKYTTKAEIRSVLGVLMPPRTAAGRAAEQGRGSPPPKRCRIPHRTCG
jgi:hypothetical protein